MSSPVELTRVIRPGQTYVGRQGFTYGAGVSRETVGETDICMNVLPMAPGAKAKSHYHKNIDTIAYLLEGRCATYYGEHLEHRAELVQGDQMFVPRNVPHAPVNDSGAPCTWIVVHACGSDQDDIVMTPHLDAQLPDV
ncbi:MAG: cupin domain-containing protein [Pseudomonadota bacterium]